MTVSNVRYYEGLPFDQYLALPQYSYSGLKGGGPFTATAKMSLGTEVHNYLLEPHKFPHTNPNAKKLALKLKEMVGPLLPFMKPELTVTAEFEHEGFVMPYKGRIDLALPGKLVVDLKVTGEDLKKVMDHFGYPLQLTGYAKAIGAPRAFIASVNTKTEKPDVAAITFNEDYWHKKILQYGFSKS